MRNSKGLPLKRKIKEMRQEAAEPPKPECNWHIQHVDGFVPAPQQSLRSAIAVAGITGGYVWYKDFPLAIRVKKHAYEPSERFARFSNLAC